RSSCRLTPWLITGSAALGIGIVPCIACIELGASVLQSEDGCTGHPLSPFGKKLQVLSPEVFTNPLCFEFRSHILIANLGCNDWGATWQWPPQEFYWLMISAVIALSVHGTCTMLDTKCCGLIAPRRRSRCWITSIAKR